MKKMIVRIALCLPILSFLLCLQTKAQGLSEADIKAQMVKDWERAKAYTVDYLNTMPADKYSFKAVDSIRSFAQQMLHLAAGNCFIMSNATDERPPSWFIFDIENRSPAQKKDSCMYYITSSYDYSMKARADN